VRAEVEYSAVVSVKVDLESGEVASVDISAQVTATSHGLT